MQVNFTDKIQFYSDWCRVSFFLPFLSPYLYFRHLSVDVSVYLSSIISTVQLCMLRPAVWADPLVLSRLVYIARFYSHPFLFIFFLCWGGSHIFTFYNFTLHCPRRSTQKPPLMPILIRNCHLEPRRWLMLLYALNVIAQLF